MNYIREMKTMYRQTYYSPLGEITMASDGMALTGLWFEGQQHFGSTLSPEAQCVALPIFRETAAWLDSYFKGEQPSALPAVCLSGTPFQIEVWKLLQQIPYGSKTTYQAIATLMAARRNRSKFSARAVGGAVGRNPVSILIPCHRVVGSNGALVGYAAGVDRKRELLRIEQGAISKGSSFL